MKKQILVITALLAPLSLQAQDGEKKGPRKPPKAAIEKFDTDGDGQLSAEEREAAKAAMKEARSNRRAEMIARFDTDGDGQLSEEEKEAAKAAAQAKRAEIIAKYDLDGDGKLNREERQAAAGELGNRGPRGARGPRKGGQGRGPRSAN